MINVPYDVLAEKIIEKAKISKQELEEKINKKLEALSGLISKEGAAHIVAGELGVNLLQVEGLIKIKDILAGMRNIDLLGNVIRKYEIRTFENEKRKGKLARFLIGDETGTTMVVLWNDKTDLLESFNEKDTIKIKSVNVRENNGRSEVHLGDESTIEVNPEGVKIDTSAIASRQVAQRKKISELKENDTNIEIFATIVQIFDPKFFEVDAQTGKRIKREDGSAPGPDATFGAVLNIFADDGSDNIRVVLWKNQIINLLGVDEKKLMEYKDNPTAFEAVKTDLLGVMVKIIGRVSNNAAFGRLEFVAQVVLRDVDPEEEIKNLKKEKPAEENKETTEPEKPAQTTPKPVEEKKPPKEKEELEDLDEELLSLDELEDMDD